MGRWAQAKRRGKGSAGSAGLPAPPAPYMEQETGQLVVSRNGLPDPSGVFRLYHSEDGAEPWTFHGELNNTEPTRFGPAGLESGEWYRATEVGGPPNYSGESPPSDELEYV